MQTGKWGIHPGFETQGRHHQKSKTGVSVAPQKVHMCPPKIKKKNPKTLDPQLSMNLDP